MVTEIQQQQVTADNEQQQQTVNTKQHIDENNDDNYLGPKGEIYNFTINEDLATYLHTVTNKEPPVCRWIREATARDLGIEIRMIPSIDQGRLLTTLAHVTNAKLVVEIGVFTGYSSTSFALGMAKEGRLVGLDISEEYTNYAVEAWRRAGVQDQMELRLGPALDTLNSMLTDEAERFEGKADLVFIDADKESMPAYYEIAMKLLRPRGIAVIDNSLWYGHTYDKNCDNDEATLAVRRMNLRIASDERAVSVQLPFSDGVTLVTKK